MKALSQVVNESSEEPLNESFELKKTESLKTKDEKPKDKYNMYSLENSPN